MTTPMEVGPDDRGAIGSLVVRLVRCLDDRRFADYAALYAQDGVLELPFGEWTGRRAIEDHVAADLGRYGATHHHIGGIDIDPHDQGALARASFIATHVPAVDPEAFWQGGGAYHVHVRRGADSWVIQRFRVLPTWRWSHGAPIPGH